MSFISGTSFGRTSINRVVGCDGDYCEDFTIDTSTQQDATSQIAVTGGVLDIEADWDTTNVSVSIDPVAAVVSDTAWVMRMKVDIITVTSGSDNIWLSHGLSSLDGSNDSNISQNFIGVHWIKQAAGPTLIRAHDGFATAFGAADGVTAFALGVVARTDWLEETRLTSTTYKIEFFSDEYVTSREVESPSCSASIVNLRYPWWGNTDSGTGGSLNLQFDDVKIKDAVTSW